MKLTIESMTYGADGLAHADNGKAVFVQGAVAGDTVEAEVVQDGKSFMRARTTEILEPSPNRIQPPCPFVGICGGCSWGNLSRTAQLAAKEQNLRSTLERIGKFAPELADELVQPICHTKDDWGYRNKIELEPTVVNGRVRLGMHGVDPSKIVTVDMCPLFDKRFPKALKSVVGALNYLSGSHDLGLERVGIRASRRTKALEVALWTPTGSFPRSQVSRVLADAAHPTSIVRVMSKGEKKARRVSKVEMLAGEGSWTENIAEDQMRLSAPSFFQVNTKGAEILIDLVMEALDPQEDELAVDLYCGAGTFTLHMTDSYYNMKEKLTDHMSLIHNAEAAMQKAGVTPKIVAIRGGTDGARLSYEGLPCPNLSTGGLNFHSIHEFIPVRSLEKMVEVLRNLVTL